MKGLRMRAMVLERVVGGEDALGGGRNGKGDWRRMNVFIHNKGETR